MTHVESVSATLSKAIQAVEAWHEQQQLHPKVTTAVEEMFLKCYPERTSLITGMRRP